jgi:hypothetical protein
MPFTINAFLKSSPPTIVTIYWNLSEQGSGAARLVIKDSTNTVLLNEESQGSGAKNGSITISESNTPYTLEVTRTAGTEVAQWRLCNDSVGVEMTSSFSVTGTDTYTVNPTPLTTTINVTYGNSNTPLACGVA